MFDNTNLLFFPGQFLSGRVIIEVDNDMPVLGRTDQIRPVLGRTPRDKAILDCMSERGLKWDVKKSETYVSSGTILHRIWRMSFDL